MVLNVQVNVLGIPRVKSKNQKSAGPDNTNTYGLQSADWA